jgi:penicillin-insensitive murein DD-endopeptidase
MKNPVARLSRWFRLSRCSFRASVAFPVVALVSLAPLAVMAAGAVGPWPVVVGPSAGPTQVIGGAGGACLAGAVALPLEGPGYQAVDISRRRYFGHPMLLGFIGDLGRTVAERQLGTMLVGDLAQARGGPMSFGHVSHQGGLDVDLWFRLDVATLPRAQREGIAQPSVVHPRTGRPDPARWSDRHAELVRRAALDPRVSRIFVGAAIKRDLCERAWPDRTWLRTVRTWPGHDDHLHVRLRCPEGSPACVEQPPLPLSDGCAPADLAAAFAHERARRNRPPARPGRMLPAACHAVLAAAPAALPAARDPRPTTAAADLLTSDPLATATVPPAAADRPLRATPRPASAH